MENILTILPLEVIILILRFILIDDIHNLRLTSKSWSQLIDQNENQIFLALSQNHGFVNHTKHGIASVEREVEGLHRPNWLRDTKHWVDYFRRRLLLELTWSGVYNGKVDVFDQKAIEVSYPVHRFKVDEEEQTVICTGTHGGLLVHTFCDRPRLATVTFAMHQVRSYAHLEWSEGFLAYTHTQSRIEVWRRANDVRRSYLGIGPVDSVDSRQQREYDTSFRPLEIDSGASEPIVVSEHERHRGVYLPYASFTQPKQFGASRCIFPTVVAVAQDGTQAWLWDLRSRSHTQTIDFEGKITRNPFIDGRAVNYVDFSERHLFIGTQTHVMIFARNQTSHDGSSLVLSFPPADKYLQDSALLVERLPVEMEVDHSRKDKGRLLHDMLFRDKVHPSHFDFSGFFVGVHVSSDGNDFVAVNNTGDFFYVEDFEEAISAIEGDETNGMNELLRRTHVHEYFIPVEEPFTRGVMYLAFDHGRIAVVTTIGIHVFALKRHSHSLRLPEPTIENLKEHKRLDMPFSSAHTVIGGFRDARLLSEVSCLQLTRDSLWLTWGQGHNCTRINFSPATDD